MTFLIYFYLNLFCKSHLGLWYSLAIVALSLVLQIFSSICSFFVNDACEEHGFLSKLIELRLHCTVENCKDLLCTNSQAKVLCILHHIV
jgi:hypothetical protein